MPRTIHCTHCGVVLNLPEQALGKRLKCPKCGEKFTAGPGGEGAKSLPKAPDPSGQSAASSVTLQSPSSGNIPSVPASGGTLRERFDLPMMAEAASTAKATAALGGGGNGQVGDALALFDDKPAAPRRKSGAEARMSSRRCPTCNAVIPVGMSLCQSCGLDLDTGTRIDLNVDLGPPRPHGRRACRSRWPCSAAFASPPAWRSRSSPSPNG